MLNKTIQESRISLLTKLAQGRFDQAQEKIQDNLDSININLNVLGKYQLKVGIADKKDYISKGNYTIETTATLIEETFILIQEFKDHKFIGFGEKLKYLKLLDANFKRCTDYKAKFEKLSEDIKKQNINIIENTRQSRLSSLKEDSGSNTARITPTFDFKEYEYVKDDLDDSIIEDRGTQINLICDISKKLFDLSKHQGEIARRGEVKLNKIEDNIDDALVNVKSAKENIDEANKINEDRHSGGDLFSTNKIMLFIVMLVGFLLFLAVFK
jgi:hypothetical protein